MTASTTLKMSNPVDTYHYEDIDSEGNNEIWDALS